MRNIENYRCFYLGIFWIRHKGGKLRVNLGQTPYTCITALYKIFHWLRDLLFVHFLKKLKVDKRSIYNYNFRISLYSHTENFCKFISKSLKAYREIILT